MSHSSLACLCLSLGPEGLHCECVQVLGYACLSPILLPWPWSSPPLPPTRTSARLCCLFPKILPNPIQHSSPNNHSGSFWSIHLIVSLSFKSVSFSSFPFSQNGDPLWQNWLFFSFCLLSVPVCPTRFSALGLCSFWNITRTVTQLSSGHPYLTPSLNSHNILYCLFFNVPNLTSDSHPL